MSTSPHSKTDTAIIGGGVAGCYCAYRFAQTRRHGQVSLFEARRRIGGRLWSVPFPSSDDAAIEMGGAFVSEAHENTRGLIRQLGLRLTLISWDSAPHYLRGHLLTDDQYRDPTAVPYLLAPDEAGQHPHALTLKILDRIVPGLRDFWPFTKSGPAGTPSALARHLRTVNIDGRPLWDWGLWNLISRMRSNEAIEFLAATHGAASAFRNSNAYDAIFTLLCEFNPGQSHFVVAGGYQQLPLALARASTHAVTFASGKQLFRVRVIAGGGFRLSFATTSGTEIVEAETVILALPKRAIQLIDLDDAILDSSFKNDLAAVHGVPAVKAYLFFDKAWWSGADQPPAQTPVSPVTLSSTDLPARQIYRFAPTADGPGVLMMFADDAAASYWAGLSSASEGGWLQDSDASPRASDALIDAAHRQLQLMHPGMTIERPTGGFVKDWSADPDGGGWHAFAPHVRSWEVRRRVLQPNPQLKLHVCGEAFAAFQGWTEGSINNTEVMLEEKFGLPRPSWVRNDYEFEAT
jgi:monoamine oxidase